MGPTELADGVAGLADDLADEVEQVDGEPGRPGEQPGQPGRSGEQPGQPGRPGEQPGRPAAGLDPRQEQMLAFERRWWRHAGAKEQAIRDTFGLSPTRYYQLLNRLLDEPGALARDPVLVSRLRRLRASRARSRLL